MQSTVTPTPEGSHFPADPFLVLQSGWPFLAAYYVIATIIVFVLWRTLRASRFLHSRRLRSITAIVLSAVFTPSEVSDFFLFNLPGPASVGLVIFLIVCVMIIASEPTALLRPELWSTLGLYYFLPLFVGFLVAYAVLYVSARVPPPLPASA
jgi:hypothetical protein